MRKTKIGIVGLNWGQKVISQLGEKANQELFEILGVCSRTESRVKRLADELGVRAYVGIDELLADPEIEAVGLFTGPIGRSEIIRRIIRTGRDVITTKPFDLDPDAALKVLVEADELKRVVHVNSPSAQLSPGMKQIRLWCDQYRLGRPIASRADTWISYREKPDGTWYDDPSKCPVSPVFRLGVYLINDLVQLVGQAKEAYVMESRIFTERPTSDNAQLALSFENGTLANVFASFCVADGQFYVNSLTLNYESGSIRRHITKYSGRVVNRMTLFTEAKGKPVVEERTFDVKSGDYQWEAFHREIRGEALEGKTTKEEIVAGLRVLQAMALSADSSKPEPVLPVRP